MIGRAEILGLVPHAGRMCLLDRVLRWDAADIVCEADSHRDPQHPLLRAGRLAALHLIEYGAQAVAVHGSLLERAAGPARSGVLASVREFSVAVERLDRFEGALQIVARRQVARSDAFLYEFEARHAQRFLAGGRVSIILRPHSVTPAIR